MNVPPVRFIAVAAAAVVIVVAMVIMRPPVTAPSQPNVAAARAAQSAAPTESMKAPTTDVQRDVRSIVATAPGTLALIGSVQAGSRAVLSVRMPTRIAAVAAVEGDVVRRGQTIIQLDDQDLAAQSRAATAGVAAARAQLDKAALGGKVQVGKAEADIAAAQSALDQARIKLRQAVLAGDAARSENRADVETAEEGVNKATIALDRAKSNLAGIESLAEVGGVSRNDLDGARAQVKLAQSDLDTARDQLKRAQSGPSTESASYRVSLAEKDVEAARAGEDEMEGNVKLARHGRDETAALADEDVLAARASLAQATAQAGGALGAQQSTRMTSPLDGVVAAVNVHVGETAQPGAPLATVVSLSNLRVDALVPGRELPRLRVGQSASIRVDTQPGMQFAATVAEIARVAEPDGRTFRVKFQFRSATNRPSRPDQTARIIVRTE